MAKPFSKHIYESWRWKKCARAFAESKLYICERCGHLVKPNEKNKLRYVVHHRQPLTLETMNDDLMVFGWDNLQLLCYECHMTVHGLHKAGRTMHWDETGNLVGFDETEQTPTSGGDYHFYLRRGCPPFDLHGILRGRG